MLFSALFMATLSTGLLRVDTSVGCPRAPSTPPLSAKSSRASSVGSSPQSSVGSSPHSSVVLRGCKLYRICYGGASPHRPSFKRVPLQIRSPLQMSHRGLSTPNKHAATLPLRASVSSALRTTRRTPYTNSAASATPVSPLTTPLTDLQVPASPT